VRVGRHVNELEEIAKSTKNSLGKQKFAKVCGGIPIPRSKFLMIGIFVLFIALLSLFVLSATVAKPTRNSPSSPYVLIFQIFMQQSSSTTMHV
jgi:hypothetical protein